MVFAVSLLSVVLAVTLAVISYVLIYHLDEDYADHAVPPSVREST